MHLFVMSLFKKPLKNLIDFISIFHFGPDHIQKIPRTQTYHLLTALQNKGMLIMVSDRITKFEGIEFEKVLDILINNELKRIEDLQSMRNKLSELWKANF